MNSYPDGPLEIKSLIRIDLPYQKMHLNSPIYINTLLLKNKNNEMMHVATNFSRYLIKKIRVIKEI